jgi:H+-translocating NAD(P) transhydrogenase subunit beta
MEHHICINFLYIVAAILFIFGLKMLGSPLTARRGNIISSLGMLIAVIATFITKGLSFQWIIIGIIIGSVAGVLMARLVAMTAMPEMVAAFNGFGGIASLFVAWAVYHLSPYTPMITSTTIFLSVLIGGVTFSGSFIAWGKLSGKLPSKPIIFSKQKRINIILLIAIVLLGILFILNPQKTYFLFICVIFLSLILGVLSVIPIGGADMPVVISLLNSYSGLAACTAGFVIQNNILIVAGSLVGASGIILTRIMCKAMNRSLTNVLFSGFGAIVQSSKEIQGEAKSVTPQDAYYVLEAARSVVIVPGYGLAVAQAQHVVKELGDLLEKNGAEVKYAIHPVAGRMPGHMNVLLAEANVPYDQLIEMNDINPNMNMVDVCIVIGANDVVNPAARNDENSPIYGMPIINVDYAKTVYVLKRSMSPGFAGIANELFYYENTRMIFGDAKQTIQEMVSEFHQE